MIDKCPICKRPLRQVNSNVFECPERKEYVPELDTHIACNHITCILDSKNNVSTETIVVLPYQIHLNYLANETSIFRLEKQINKYSKNKNKSFKFNLILKIDGTTKFNWNNRERLIDKVKLLMLFS
jgi:hypothetical protein